MPKDLVTAADDFRTHLTKIRASVEPRRFEWYPYDSYGNFPHIVELFRKSGLDFEQIAVPGPVLDVGCADGDISFCLESWGSKVVALDHPRGNHNGMSGVRALWGALRSNVELLQMDVDGGLELGGRYFELALILGLLYHLKNPLYVLENVAKHARYCVLSTRITRFLPESDIDISGVPLAYLLGADELNEDNSNYWIFSEAGLRRLFARSHWRLLASANFGDVRASRPDNLENDERIFCLLESTYGLAAIERLYGWHEAEDTGWRWTESRFAARVRPQGSAGKFQMELFVPDALIERFGAVTLHGSFNGWELPPVTFHTSGLHTYQQRLQPIPREAVETCFFVDKALPPDNSDRRERSLIIADISVH